MAKPSNPYGVSGKPEKPTERPERKEIRSDELIEALGKVMGFNIETAREVTITAAIGQRVRVTVVHIAEKDMVLKAWATADQDTPENDDGG